MLQGCRVHNPSEVGELVAPSFFENRFNGIIILTECGMMTPHELMFHDTTVLLDPCFRPSGYNYFDNNIWILSFFGIPFGTFRCV